MLDKNRHRTLISFWILFSVVTVFIASLALVEAVVALRSRDISLVSNFGGLVMAFQILGGLFGISSLLLLLLAKKSMLRLVESLDRPARGWRWGGFLVALALLVVLLIAEISPSVYGRVLGGTWTLVELFWLMFIVSTLNFKFWRRTNSWGRSLAGGVILTAILLNLLPLIAAINNYPFAYSIDGEFLYFSSLIVSERLYGMRLPVSFIYTSLSLLDSIPFLLGDPPIWVHRLWSAFLNIGLTVTASLCLVRRLKVSDRLLRGLLLGWVFLYLFNAHVKYELLICVIPILAGVSRRRDGAGPGPPASRRGRRRHRSRAGAGDDRQ